MANLCRYKRETFGSACWPIKRFLFLPSRVRLRASTPAQLGSPELHFCGDKEQKKNGERSYLFLPDSSDFRQARRRLYALWVKAVICAAGVNHLPGTACLGFLLLFLSSCVPLAQTSILNEHGETFDSFFVRVSSIVLSPLFYSVGTICFRRSSCASPFFF